VQRRVTVTQRCGPTQGSSSFTFGNGCFGMLGRGGQQHEPVPMLVGALAGKKVARVSAGYTYKDIAVRTDTWELGRLSLRLGTVCLRHVCVVR
jgi:hypothetical protein